MSQLTMPPVFPVYVNFTLDVKSQRLYLLGYSLKKARKYSVSALSVGVTIRAGKNLGFFRKSLGFLDFSVQIRLDILYIIHSVFQSIFSVKYNNTHKSRLKY